MSNGQESKMGDGVLRPSHDIFCRSLFLHLPFLCVRTGMIHTHAHTHKTTTTSLISVTSFLRPLERCCGATVNMESFCVRKKKGNKDVSWGSASCTLGCMRTTPVDNKDWSALMWYPPWILSEWKIGETPSSLFQIFANNTHQKLKTWWSCCPGKNRLLKGIACEDCLRDRSWTSVA